MSAIALLLLLTAPQTDAAAIDSPPADDADVSWSLVTINGNPIGYEFSQTDETDAGSRFESVSLMSMKRFGQAFEMRMKMTFEEDADGRLTSFRMEQASPGQPPQVSSGTVDDGTMTVTTPSGAGAMTRTIELDEDVLAPSAVEAVIRDATPGPGEERTVKTFAIETLAPVTMTVTGLGPQETAGRDGKPLTLRGVRVTRSDMPLSPTYFLDEEGEVIKTELGLMNMVAWKAGREEALAAAGGSDFDFGVRSLLRVPPSPGLEKKRSARYRVTGGELPQLPGVQSVTQRGDALIVTVTTPDLGEASVSGEDTTPPGNGEYLASTRWVDWETPEVSALADRIDRSLPAGERAKAAEKLVRRSITATSYGVGFASAGETAKSKEGDCTEHGVLLCGVLRANGIPSRVAYGLVYVDSAAAMVPHMWTEAYLGDGWKPLDATRPGWPEAGYLKFGDSDLQSDAALPATELIKLSQGVDAMSVRVLETSDTNLTPAE